MKIMGPLSPLKRVVVGISGGVDSAVATIILKSKGFDLTGVFMKNWDLVDEFGDCTLSDDLRDAKYVCERLSVPFCEVNFVKEYWNSVFIELISDYENGLTPNPDIMCNKFIKFNAFSDYAIKTLGADALATGHYARNSYGQFLDKINSSKNAKLLTSNDRFKDQTFFLSQISQHALQKTMFPLGDLTKHEVKKIALENGLGSIANKKESMGICFIGSRNFQEFISEYIKPSNGLFIDIDTGRPVGEHKGKHNWTLGQKCRIGGMTDSYYIASKTGSEDIYVAKGHFHPALYSSMLCTYQPYWIDSEPSELVDGYMLSCQFRFQHSKPLVNCTVIRLSDSELWVKLEKPLRALTPGQFAVFYKDNECLGSARIHTPGPSLYTLNSVTPNSERAQLL